MRTLKQFIQLEEGREYWGDSAAGVTLRAKDTGRLLFMLRSSDVMEPNTWGSISGKIDPGEDPEQAMLRELEEETGINPALVSNLKNYDTFEDGRFKFYNYLGEVPEEFEPTLNWENDDFMWVEPGDFPEPLHFGMDRVRGHLS